MWLEDTISSRIHGELYPNSFKKKNYFKRLHRTTAFIFLVVRTYYVLQLEPIRRGLEDSNSYVRKTAVIGKTSDCCSFFLTFFALPE